MLTDEPKCKIPKLQDSRPDSMDGIVAQAAQRHYLSSADANSSQEISLNDQASKPTSETERTGLLYEIDFDDLKYTVLNTEHTTRSKILLGETSPSEGPLGTGAYNAAVQDISEPMRILGLGASRTPPRRFHRTFWRAISRKALLRAKYTAQSE